MKKKFLSVIAICAILSSVAAPYCSAMKSNSSPSDDSSSVSLRKLRNGFLEDLDQIAHDSSSNPSDDSSSMFPRRLRNDASEELEKIAHAIRIKEKLDVAEFHRIYSQVCLLEKQKEKLEIEVQELQSAVGASDYSATKSFSCAPYDEWPTVRRSNAAEELEKIAVALRVRENETTNTFYRYLIAICRLNRQNQELELQKRELQELQKKK